MSAVKPLLPEIDFAYAEVPDLHDLIDTLRPHGPVVPVKYLGDTVWLINSFRELKRAFSDEEHFASEAAYRVHSEPSMGRTLQTMSGEMHRINRALVSKPFFPRQMRKSVESLIVPVADELLDRIEGRDEVEFVQAFTRPFPFTVITRMLGIPVDNEGRLLEWALKLIDYPWDPEGALRAKRDFGAYMQPILAQRRSHPGDDVISTLATAQFEGERLDDEEILSFLRLLFPAGSDTTYKVGGSLFYAVLSDPAMRARALRDDAQREAIVQEALRWQPPTALLPRRCSKDTELGGVKIRKDDWVLFGITAANSDPAVFADPRRFGRLLRVVRERSGHQIAMRAEAAKIELSDAAGWEHFCLGSHLARRELETALERVLTRFPAMRLAPGHSVRFTGGPLRGTPELWVRPTG